MTILVVHNCFRPTISSGQTGPASDRAVRSFTTFHGPLLSLSLIRADRRLGAGRDHEPPVVG
jgi:hypothetical protein